MTYYPEEEYPEDDYYDDDYDPHFDDPNYGEDLPRGDPGFADPGGNSALRAATPDNPRDQPCPTCGEENVLTRYDVQRHYQCNRCADRDERGGY